MTKNKKKKKVKKLKDWQIEQRKRKEDKKR